MMTLLLIMVRNMSSAIDSHRARSVGLSKESKLRQNVVYFSETVTSYELIWQRHHFFSRKHTRRNFMRVWTGGHTTSVHLWVKAGLEELDCEPSDRAHVNMYLLIRLSFSLFLFLNPLKSHHMGT